MLTFFSFRCRGVLRIIGETLSAYRIAKSEKWHQIFTDGTSRRQISMTGVIVSIMEDDNVIPLLLSSCHVAKGETSEDQAEAIENVIKRGRTWLEQWMKVCGRIFPDFIHDIPKPREMDLVKLNNAWINTDTCNAARKARRTIKNSIIQAAKDNKGKNIFGYFVQIIN